MALLTGVPGAFNLEERIRGFKDGVEGSNIEIVTTTAIGTMDAMETAAGTAMTDAAAGRRHPIPSPIA